MSKKLVWVVLFGIYLIAGVFLVNGLMLTANAANTIATIAPEAPAGRWVAEQGFITTAPNGDKFACELGLWTPEFEPDEVSLECVPFVDPKRYKGHKDGELELIS